MPGTLTTTNGNRLQHRQIEFGTLLQIFRHFLGGHRNAEQAFGALSSENRARRVFHSENGVAGVWCARGEYFLDGKNPRVSGIFRGETRAGKFRVHARETKAERFLNSAIEPQGTQRAQREGQPVSREGGEEDAGRGRAWGGEKPAYAFRYAMKPWLRRGAAGSLWHGSPDP